MKIYQNERYRWVIERDKGRAIELAWNESSLFYEQMLKASIWDDIELRFPDDEEEFIDQFGYSREEIEAAKDNIVEELLPEMQEISEDLIYHAITKYC